jgi:hypothetical protein
MINVKHAACVLKDEARTRISRVSRFEVLLRFLAQALI